MKKIDSFRGEYAFLSNFYPSPVPYQGLLYPTVEHAYQAAKTSNQSERLKIAMLDTPGKAKRAGASLGKPENWYDISIGIMEALLYEKFSRYEDLAQKLLATGDAELVEGNNWGDVFWGQVNGVGENHLGRLLMQVRDSLKEQSAEADPKSFIDGVKEMIEGVKRKFKKQEASDE